MGAACRRRYPDIPADGISGLTMLLLERLILSLEGAQHKSTKVPLFAILKMWLNCISL
jgi:hypothetical protein